VDQRLGLRPIPSAALRSGKPFIEQIRALVNDHLSGTVFYELGDSFEEALRRVLFLKKLLLLPSRGRSYGR